LEKRAELGRRCLVELMRAYEDDSKRVLADITFETARTPLAASRYKRIVAKRTPVAGQTLQKIILDLITGEAKKYLSIP
jgi:hypothetical protein